MKNGLQTLTCCEPNYTSVGQTIRHLATKIEEHKKEDLPAGTRIRQCGEEATTAQLSWEIIGQLNNAMKLLTLEALHIRKLRRGINTPDEFRIRKLTFKI